MRLAEWLNERIKNGRYAKSTNRTYKAALLSYFKHLAENTPRKAEAIIFLSNVYNDRSPKKKIKETSAKKSKSLSEGDYEKLKKYVDKHGTKYQKEGLKWLRATIDCGLRPSEWKSAELVKREFNTGLEDVLKVRNGKNTNNRANGDYRHIVITKFEPENFNNVTALLSFLKTSDITFESKYEKCRKAINYASRQTFPRRKHQISLYSARHQFAANMKLAGYSKKLVAALMGHGDALTASMKYARSKKGSEGPQKVGALKIEVATVKTKNLEKSEAKMANVIEKNTVKSTVSRPRMR